MSVDKELFQAAATITAAAIQAAKTPEGQAVLIDDNKMREHFVRTYLALNQAALDIQDLTLKRQGYGLPERYPHEPARVNWD